MPRHSPFPGRKNHPLKAPVFLSASRSRPAFGPRIPANWTFHGLCRIPLMTVSNPHRNPTSKQKTVHASGPALFREKKNDSPLHLPPVRGPGRGNPPERLPQLFSHICRIANYPFERQWKEKGECVPVGNRSLYSEHLNESFKYKSRD